MGNLKTKYDVIIIGSGASGSVIAYKMAKAGLSTLVLEKGKFEDPTTFEHDELAMYRRLYKNGGLQTSKDNDITFAQGQTVGGSTVVNNAIWIRPNVTKVLETWKSFEAHIDEEKLLRSYEYVESKLEISDLDRSVCNIGSDDFISACQRLGYKSRYLKNNRDKCIGCGWCNYGCKYNRKSSMLVTFIPWSQKHGAEILDLVMDLKINVTNNKAVSVQFNRGRGKYNISCDKLIVSAGAIGSSEVLLQNRINPKGNTGKGFHCLGGFLTTGVLDKVVNGYDGIGLTCIADVSSDYLVETFFAPPGIFSSSVGGWFEEHFELMQSYNKMFQIGVMVGSEPSGRIKLSKNKAQIDFKFSKQDIAKMKEGLSNVSKILFEMGATKVIPASFKDIIFNNVSDLSKINKLITGQDDFILGSAHPQGGNRMSDDPKRGVVDSNFKIHGMDNMYVCDASVFPYNIRANCQATVMSMANYFSDNLLDA